MYVITMTNIAKVFVGNSYGWCTNTLYRPENVEHCGGEPEQAANGFDIGFVTSK